MKLEIEKAENGFILRETYKPGEWDENEKVITQVFICPTDKCISDELDDDEISAFKGFMNTLLDKLGFDYEKYSRQNFVIDVIEGHKFEYNKHTVDLLKEKIQKYKDKLEGYQEELDNIINTDK